MRWISRSASPVRITTRLADPSTVVAVPIDVVTFAYNHGVYELPSCSDPLDVVAATGVDIGCTTARGFDRGDPISQPLNETATARATKRGQLADMPPNVS